MHISHIHIYIYIYIHIYIYIYIYIIERERDTLYIRPPRGDFPSAPDRIIRRGPAPKTVSIALRAAAASHRHNNHQSSHSS